MSHKCKLVALFAGTVILIGLVAGSPPCSAQIFGGMETSVTPYLWGAGVDAKIKTPLPNASEVTSSRSFSDTVGHLEGLPFMGSFELRQGALGFVGDLIHLPVGANITTRNFFYNGGNADLTATTGTALFLYRPLADPVQFVDVGVGVRVWSFSADLKLNGGLLAPASVSRSAAWADPLIAARYHRELGNGFGMTVYGDAGGFGAGADLDWQLAGTIDYAPNTWLTLRGGYRAITFNYRANNSLGFNVRLRGPIIATTIRF